MKTESIPEVIRITSNVSLILPLMMYLIRIRHASRQVHIIGALIVVSGICDLIGLMLFNRSQSTVVLFNTYYALLFFLLTWFYYEILFVNTRRMMIWIGLAVYLQSFILITLFVQNFFQYQTVMWLITAIIMIFYSISYFFYSISSITTSGHLGYSLVWINIGVMIYFCLNLFLFIMGNYVLTKLDPETSAMIWSSHNVNNIIKNILFAVGIYFYRKKIAEF
ncbi:MAG TPA: hypothetical protein VFT90_01760 [Chryseosolibacter sp.]|nr:hypothetical protein [Chryseosolibacter sp.]